MIWFIWIVSLLVFGSLEIKTDSPWVVAVVVLGLCSYFGFLSWLTLK